ncbi:MAG: hypothetical protein QOI10_1751 [Solirubrobacterales bacterium]|jgi:hypothetical protein|nr:hypothetical protein [Solirubrobacterales bacterium]
MWRAAAIAVCLAALLVPATAPAGSSEPVPDRVQVTGSEYNLLLSKPKLVPGRVIVQFINSGEDSHDLKLQRLGASGQEGPELGLGEVEPGQYANLDTHLRKGARYVLWCSLTGHRQLGMEATLKVARHRR